MAHEPAYYFAFVGYIPFLWEGFDVVTAPHPLTRGEAEQWFRQNLVDTALSGFTEGEIRAANNECNSSRPLTDLVIVDTILQSDSPIHFSGL
jgi:hypothetical protein